MMKTRRNITRTFGGFAAILVLMLIVGAVSIRNTYDYAAGYTRLYRENVLSAVYLAGAQNALWQLRYATPQFMVGDAAAREKILADEPKWIKLISDNLDAYENVIVDPEERQTLAALREVYATYLPKRPVWFALYGAGKIEEAKEARKTQTPLAAATVKALEKLITLQKDHAEAGLERMQEEIRIIKIVTFALLGLALAGGLLIGILITRGILTPISRAVGFAGAIAQGDLSRRLAMKSRDEVGMLSTALDGMAERLSEIVVTIKESAEQVATSSRQISASTVSLAEGAQNQASTLEQTAGSVVELTASVEQVSQHARSQMSAVDGGNQAMQEVRGSLEELSRSLAGVASISRDSVTRSREGVGVVDQVVEAISAISSGSEKISGIIGMISEIADQTNLLALNAAIEAARAGDQGRGFAVVADEVGKLADRSSTSAKEIAGLIKESVKQVTSGVALAEGARTVMEQITGEAQKASDMLDGLTLAMERQAASINQLNEALERIHSVSQTIDVTTAAQNTTARRVAGAIDNVAELTQRAASATDQMTTATEEMAGLALSLQGLVDRFTLSHREHAMVKSA
jgi:methyl-accepting chemotaxis protein